MTLEVMHQHEKLELESGVKFLELVSGACVRGLRQVTAALYILLIVKLIQPYRWHLTVAVKRS